MAHPLNESWCLYLHYKDLGNCYNENLEKLIEINDIETFWKTYNNIPKSYEIFSDGVNTKKMKRNNATPCAYSFFRKNIQPCWEDPKNTNGFEFSTRSNKNLHRFESEWIYNLVVLISDLSENCSHINGLRIVDCTKLESVMYRMEVWIDDEENKESIEKFLKSNFKLSGKILYRSHKNIKETA